MTTTTTTCRDCGKPFAASRTGATVRCPDCRAGRTAVTTACVVCNDTRTVTYGPSVIDGRFTTVPCHRCAGDDR